MLLIRKFTKCAYVTSQHMSDSPTLSVTLLGAGQEVGRSCCVLKYRGKTVVCDAGEHVEYASPLSLRDFGVYV